MSAPYGRATCPVCGEEFNVTKDGRMRHHNGDVWVNGWRQVCKGAGQLPRAVTTSPEPAPAVPRDELAGMLRPFVSSGSDEWEMADELLAYLDIRLRTEGSDT